jgi:hypothetical protein
MRIGIALLTHDRPEAARRLIATLNALLDHPPIAWHHDFAKTSIDRDPPSPNVHFIDRPAVTGWATWGIVEATCLAVQKLYQVDDPDWFYILSGSCYPIRTKQQMIDDIQRSAADVWIRHKLVTPEFEADPWVKQNQKHYCERTLLCPWINRKFRPILKQFKFSWPATGWPLFPYRTDMPCRGGDHWHAGNRRVGQAYGQYILKPALVKHYRKRHLPEESIFHTVFASRPELKVENRCPTYTHWTPGEWHPKTLGMSDLPKMLASPSHFARKFHEQTDAHVLDELDKVIGIK